ncbi:hypothetical protein CKAH01_00329 [Colletotrichum kahawae]|uniref:Uncharacterized protein n=1 Tax=Colletotrichum kahawae TaxID=34407 RepID=A0AAE0DEH2_COLKA|nr:hypothetical protein CKAH01_00329 [Colletotrichum kahawae]
MQPVTSSPWSKPSLNQSQGTWYASNSLHRVVQCKARWLQWLEIGFVTGATPTFASGRLRLQPRQDVCHRNLTASRDGYTSADVLWPLPKTRLSWDFARYRMAVSNGDNAAAAAFASSRTVKQRHELQLHGGDKVPSTAWLRIKWLPALRMQSMAELLPMFSAHDGEFRR